VKETRWHLGKADSCEEIAKWSAMRLYQACDRLEELEKELSNSYVIGTGLEAKLEALQKDNEKWMAKMEERNTWYDKAIKAIERCNKAETKLEATKNQRNGWQKLAMAEKSNVTYWKAKLEGSEKEIERLKSLTLRLLEDNK
jgi:septal ring factor EnvC (AmiA/AmiB activator)